MLYTSFERPVAGVEGWCFVSRRGQTVVPKFERIQTAHLKNCFWRSQVSKPRDYCSCPCIYILHHVDLVTPLQLVQLINTNGIDPEVTPATCGG